MKKIFISLLVLSIAVVYAQKLTLEDVWLRYSFYPKYVSGLRSMNDGLYYTTLQSNKIVKYSYKTGKEAGVLFDLSKIKGNDVPKSVSEYEFSSDEKKILISDLHEAIYRHSYKADYYIYDTQTGKMTRLYPDDKVQLATFSPKADKVAFVYKNNLYYKDLQSNQIVQITKDGEWNNIINGAPDWVYEEEFSFSKAFEWSPKGDKIAFLRFDESKVKQFSMTYYGKLYPTEYKFKYPKAGETNSIVTVHIYNLNTKENTLVDTGNETDQYIPRIKWTKDNNLLSFIRLNRLQNKFELLLADPKGNSNVIYTETDKRYVELFDDLTFLEDGQHFIISSEKDGFKHLYLYDLNGKLVNRITNGNWEVADFLGYNAKNKLVYYTSTENSPLQRQLYSIKIDGSKKTQLSEKAGTHEINFSHSYKYYIDFYTNANTPYYITLRDSKGKLIRVLEDNKALLDKMKEYNFVKKEFFSFKTSEGVELNGWMYKPANFDKTKKYPVFMHMYGGPGSQEVTDSWNYNDVWYQLLAQKGYLVVCVDNRGTGGRGAEFKKLTYGQLGKYETIDQIEAAKYIGSLPYADASRISMQGWSYGGYMSTLCLEKGAGVFKTAIAVAPVTNWRYYDSIYTERYMGLPQDNADGYDDNSPINHTELIKGKYLLMHGLADDNVHFQNSAELITKLIQNEVQFDLMIYPNKNHGIYGGNTRHYLFKKMLLFLEENL